MLFIICSTHRQFSELTLFLTDMTQSTQSRKWKDSDDKMSHKKGYKVQIYSSSVPVPKLWDKFMSNDTNKAELAKFLCEQCSSQYVACVPSGKMFLLSGGFVDREKAVIMRDGSCEL